MGRRFSGQRIVSEIDFARPSSMMLTDDDLLHIPDPFEQLNLGEVNQKKNKYSELQANGTKLSRRFGGTLRLRKRLTSVPELLLHNINQKKNLPSTPATMDPKIVGNSRVSSKSIGKPMPPVLEIVGSGEIAPMEKIPSKPTKKRMVRSPLAGEPITNMRLESNYIVMPITTEPVNASLEGTIHKSVTSTTDDNLDDRPFLKYRERASKSDLLMDEIMNLYSSSEDSIERTPIIKQKIDDFIDTVHESLMNHKASRTVNAKIKRVDVKPVIVDENVTNKNSCSGTLGTEEITSNDVLNADISSPEYTTSGGSDQSSGGEEFSDLDSIAPVFKSPVSTSDESFYSCFDDIPRESEKHFTATNDVSLGRHFSARNMEATVIKTRVLEINDMVGFSDNEDEIETDLGASLEEYIDMSNDPFIQIVDDTSSSMYSGSLT